MVIKRGSLWQQYSVTNIVFIPSLNQQQSPVIIMIESAEQPASIVVLRAVTNTSQLNMTYWTSGLQQTDGDVTLLVDQHSIPAHSVLLKRHMAHLRTPLAKLDSNQADMSTDGTGRARLQLCSALHADTVQPLVHFMYSAQITVDSHTLLPLLKAAQHLEMASAGALLVQELVAQSAQDNHMLKEALQQMALSHTITLSSPQRKHLLQMATQRFSELRREGLLPQLSESAITQLLANDHLCVPEIELFVAALEWVLVRYPAANNSSPQHKLFDQVRFSLLTGDQLAHCAKLVISAGYVALGHTLALKLALASWYQLGANHGLPAGSIGLDPSVGQSRPRQSVSTTKQEHAETRLSQKQAPSLRHNSQYDMLPKILPKCEHVPPINVSRSGICAVTMPRYFTRSELQDLAALPDLPSGPMTNPASDLPLEKVARAFTQSDLNELPSQPLQSQNTPIVPGP